MATHSDLIDNLAEKVAAMFSTADGGASFKDDAQRNLRAVIQSAFSKLDIVSREEFDAQVVVLKRSREKIEQLELQLAALSEQMKD
jgi:BMFP domain-containing protein YqiC